MPSRFLNNININDEYSLPNADGSADQIITTDGAGQLSFVDQSTLVSGSAERVSILVKNGEGAQLVKGDPVYIIGSVGASARLKVGLCDASDPSKMPCVGLLEQNLLNNGEGTAVTAGKLRNLITTPIDGQTTTENDTIYVKAGGSSGSALTTTKPTGSTNLIQNVGQVGRVSTSSDGNFVVSAIMRTNDVPNLPTGKIWVGDGNTVESTVVHLDEPNGRMGIGTTSPATKLEVVGVTTSLGFRTDTTNTNWSLISRDSAGNSPLYVQSANSVANQWIARFNYGSAIANGGDNVLTIAKDNSYFLNTNVGIGTTSPSQRAVISGPSTNPLLNTTVPSSATLLLSNSDTAYGTYFCSLGTGTGLIQQRRQTSAVYYDLAINPYGGNVGIGTTSPNNFGFLEKVLNISAGSSSSTTLQQAGIVISGSSDGDDADDFGYLSFTNYQSAITNDRVAEIRALKNGTNVDTGEFAFYTSSGSGPAERMRIDSSGNVGIGTASPGAKLDVEGGGVGDAQGDSITAAIFRAGRQNVWFQNQRTAAGTDWNNNTFKIIAKIDSTSHQSINFVNDASYQEHIDIYTGNQVFNTRFNANGNVGIGTASPVNKLNVNGDIGYIGVIGQGSIYGNTGNSSYANMQLYNPATGYSTFNNQSYGYYLQTGGSTKLTILNNGNVGVGTTSPLRSLSVFGAGIVSSEFKGSNAGGHLIDISNSNASPTYNGIRFQHNNTFKMGVTHIADGTTKGYIQIGNGYAAGNEILVVDGRTSNVGIGTTSPSSRLQVAGGVQMADDTDAASADKVGTLRYRTSGNNSYVDMCMQTGATTYEWVNIVQNNW